METRLPLVLPRGPQDLFRSVVDGPSMLSWFQRTLPALAACPIEVTAAKAARSRTLVHRSQLRVVYRVTILGATGQEWEHTLVGVVPSERSFLSAELLARCAENQDHPAAAPFRRLATYVDELRMGLLILPLDPDMPALAEVTGRNGRALLAPYLPECVQGASISEAEWTLRHYKPARRCVLRYDVQFSPGAWSGHRVVYVKIFDDDEGQTLHESMSGLWETACRSECLRTPEALGYDAQRRMVVMSEVLGERSLSDWIKCLEKDQPLPPGVDMSRLRHCMEMTAQALWELQGAAVRPERQRRFRDEVAGLRRDLDLLRGGHTALGLEIEELLGRLEGLAPQDDRLVPAHGGFRHKQMVGDDRGLSIVDWDGLCLAHPALDAATFLTRLRRDSILAPGSAPRVEELAAIFRRDFVGRAHVAPREMGIYEALVLAGGALRAYRRPGRGDTAVTRARSLLAGAHRLLDDQS